jgi:C-terminal processing protease CtpA/Prc
VANLVRESKTVQLPGIMQINKAAGMSLLNDELQHLIETGKVEMAEALSKAVDKDDLARRFRTGLTLSQASPAADTFRVANVAPNSPGATAGLSRGDEILELDGKPSAQFTLEEIRQAIRTDGKRMLTVARDGKRVKLVMELGGRDVLSSLAAGGAARTPRRTGA